MMQPGDSTPLWRQLQAASQVLQNVRAGASGSAAVEAIAAPLRPAVQALSFHAWRNLGRAEALRSQLAKRAPPPAADALLCLALALIWQEEDAPYEAFTLVNQCVEAAKHTPAARAQANFLNACLRRFLRERDALVALTHDDVTARWNHPLWWVQRLKKDHPDHWQTLLLAAQQQAPMCLRVNTQKTTVAAYLRDLAAQGIQGHAVGRSGIVLARAVPVPQLPGFAAGQVSVQDAAAQMAAALLLDGLSNLPNMRVLDACAAPGGKTGHLLEYGVGEVLALDVDARRCARINDNLQRLGLAASVVAADAAQTASWWDSRPFDAILLDAPCTASGIVRRHPDIRWLRRESDVAQLAAIQKKLLQTLWPLVAPGGRLLYCTCSVFRAEGDLQVQTFLAHNTDAALLPSPGHLIPHGASKTDGVTDNQHGDHDGFFYALFQKRLG